MKPVAQTSQLLPLKFGGQEQWGSILEVYKQVPLLLHWDPPQDYNKIEEIGMSKIIEVEWKKWAYTGAIRIVHVSSSTNLTRITSILRITSTFCSTIGESGTNTKGIITIVTATTGATIACIQNTRVWCISCLYISFASITLTAIRGVCISENTKDSNNLPNKETEN